MHLCVLNTRICIFAAILGMYTLMSNKQYYDALGATGRIANTEGINSMSLNHINFCSIICDYSLLSLILYHDLSVNPLQVW